MLAAVGRVCGPPSCSIGKRVPNYGLSPRTAPPLGRGAERPKGASGGGMRWSKVLLNVALETIIFLESGDYEYLHSALNIRVNS
jgi:hypothetical protein